MTTHYWTYIGKITATDGTAVRFTDLDRDITIGGETYERANAILPTEMETTSTLSVNNGEIGGPLVLTGLNADDLRNGRFDGATIELALVDFKAGTVLEELLYGWLGNQSLTDVGYQIEFRSLSSKLQDPVGRRVLSTCPFAVGDAMCTVVLASITVTGTVTSVVDSSEFTDSSRTEDAGWFDYANLTFTSGANAGISSEVKTYSGGTFELLFPFPHDIAEGDEYTTYAGCDKTKAQCRDKFDNLPRFGGNDQVPGQDAILSTA